MLGRLFGADFILAPFELYGGAFHNLACRVGDGTTSRDSCKSTEGDDQQDGRQHGAKRPQLRSLQTLIFSLSKVALYKS